MTHLLYASYDDEPTAAQNLLNDLNRENSICDDNCTLFMFSQWTTMCTNLTTQPMNAK